MPYEITFKHLFDIADRDQYINDCCFAGDVVVARLLPIVTANYKRVESNQEDWGWFIWFRKDELRLAVDVHCRDSEAGEFVIQLVARRPRWVLGDRIVDGPELDALRERVVGELSFWLGTTPEVRVMDATEFG